MRARNLLQSLLAVSQADLRPVYLQLMEQIRHWIAVGDWLPGHELPSIRALAVEVGVSVIVAKRASGRISSTVRAMLSCARSGVLRCIAGQDSLQSFELHRNQSPGPAGHNPPRDPAQQTLEQIDS